MTPFKLLEAMQAACPVKAYVSLHEFSDDAFVLRWDIHHSELQEYGVNTCEPMRYNRAVHVGQYHRIKLIVKECGMSLTEGLNCARRSSNDDVI